MSNLSADFLTFVQENLEYDDYVYKNATYCGDQIINSQPRPDLEGKQLSVMGKEFPYWNNNEAACYLFLNNYMPGRFFLPWFAPINDYDRYIEGWKLHIALETYEEYLFAIQHVLPSFIDMEITHKIVRPDCFEELNNPEEHPVQRGKIITVYAEDLSVLSNLNPLIKEFLLLKNGIDIVTDKHIGGKCFVRYTGLSQDYLIHPETKRRYEMPREAGLYKPEWIGEPPTLFELFETPLVR